MSNVGGSNGCGGDPLFRGFSSCFDLSFEETLMRAASAVSIALVAVKVSGFIDISWGLVFAPIVLVAGVSAATELLR